MHTANAVTVNKTQSLVLIFEAKTPSATFLKVIFFRLTVINSPLMLNNQPFGFAIRGN